MKSYARVKTACYMTNIAMSVVANISPVLFLTFRTLYDISYSLLGLLVLVNFSSQLVIDLIFSFFSHKFNIARTVKLIPVLTLAGLFVYAVWPLLLPGSVYVGLVVGTLIFSVSGGLAEVLISPVIAAIPAKDPDREMSKLHSVYAWGVVGVVLFSTVFLRIFGARSWHVLALIFMLVPLAAALLYAGCVLPEMAAPERVGQVFNFLKDRGLWMCVAAIFLGGAAECTMAQWCSGYLEKAVGVPKLWGDIFGVALFSVMLGTGRSLYASSGRRIGRVLSLGAVGAAVCYGLAALCDIPVIGLLACALTGLCTSMMWPGSLIVAADRIPTGGVFMYAMMAAGGDLGASVGPQLVGIVTDAVIALPGAEGFAASIGVTEEQLGMKCGMLVGMLFPLCGIAVYAYLVKSRKRFAEKKE